MIKKFEKYKEKFKEISNLQEIIIKDDEDNYVKSEEPMELVQITGLLTDEEEIKKVEESFMPDTHLNISGDLKRGQIIWLTALLKRPGSSYSNQTLGVVKCRVVDYYYGLTKLNQVTK